jgi:hypothetical protein
MDFANRLFFHTRDAKCVDLLARFLAADTCFCITVTRFIKSAVLDRTPSLETFV